MPSTIEQWLRLHAVAGGSARYYHLNEMEAWYWGHQYSNRAFTWEDISFPPGHPKAGQPIPAREKQPLVRYPLARRMVVEAADLLVGEGRFPSLRVDGDEFATEALTKLLGKARLHAKSHQLARSVITTGATALAFHLRGGRPTLITYPAKHCEPVFGDDDVSTAAQYGIEDDDLVHLRVQYLYTKEELRSRRWKTIWYAFRRDYTPDRIIHYDEPELGEDGADIQRIPEFKVVSEVVHNYGFVPVEWFRTEDVDDDSEGSGIFEHITDVLEDIDYQLSRLASSVEYNVDPLIVFSGVAHNEFSQVQAALLRGKGNTLNLGESYRDGAEKSAKYLEMTGASIELAMKHIEAQRARALECAQVVIQRYEEGAGAQSGVALDKLYRPMLSLIHGYRAQVGPSLGRFCRKLLAAADMRRSELQGLSLPSYTPGDVTVEWPPVFEPTAEELQAHATTMVTLVGARILSQETATERTAPMLRIGDVAQEKERIAAEEEAAMSQARASVT